MGDITEIDYDNANFSFNIEMVEENSEGISYNLTGTELLPNRQKVNWNIEDLPEISISDIEISVPKIVVEEKEIDEKPTLSNSTSSSSSSTSTPSSSSYGDEVPENIETAIVVVLQQTVERLERLSGVDWPWGFDDYHINNLGGDMYNTFGQFSHNGFIYNFELIKFMRPDTSGRVEFYNVY